MWPVVGFCCSMPSLGKTRRTGASFAHVPFLRRPKVGAKDSAAKSQNRWAPVQCFVHVIDLLSNQILQGLPSPALSLSGLCCFPRFLPRRHQRNSYHVQVKESVWRPDQAVRQADPRPWRWRSRHVGRLVRRMDARRLANEALIPRRTIVDRDDWTLVQGVIQTRLLAPTPNHEMYTLTCPGILYLEG